MNQRGPDFYWEVIWIGSNYGLSLQKPCAKSNFMHTYFSTEITIFICENVEFLYPVIDNSHVSKYKVYNSFLSKKA